MGGRCHSRIKCKIFRSKSNFERKIGMAIGVEGDSEQSLKNLILRPFKK